MKVDRISHHSHWVDYAVVRIDERFDDIRTRDGFIFPWLRR